MIVGQASVARDNVEDDFAAFEIETEFQFTQTSIAHCCAQAIFIFFAVEHEEATAAGAGNFAADGAVGLGEFIPGVDVRIGNAIGEALFDLPMDIEEFSEATQIAAL